jgi:hypothetical protein
MQIGAMGLSRFIRHDNKKAPPLPHDPRMTCSVLSWNWSSEKPVLVATQDMALQECARVDPGPNLAAAWSVKSPSSAEELLKATLDPNDNKALLTQGFVKLSPMPYGLPPVRIPKALCPFSTAACTGRDYGIGLPTTVL